MNTSFGMAPAPSPSGDPLSSSSESKSPLPLFSAAFSLPSANFSFQGIPSRPPSSDFSVGGPSCFPFPNGPSPAVVPPASLARPQPGFTVRGPYGNTLTPSTLTNTQPPVSGQNPRIFMRPFSSTAMQASASGVQSTQVQPVHEGGPTPHVPGTAPALPPPPSPLHAIGVSSQIGAMPSTRPGVLLPTSMFLHPRTASIAASRGMAPRFPAPPFAPPVRPSNFTSRSVSLHVRPPATALSSGTVLPKFPEGPPGADLSTAAGPFLLLEKPQTLVYVGKIASTVDEDLLRSILELCGPVKSWKRAQEPTTGTPKGFGFCEFEFPGGVLRALRLLNGFNLDGQELKITVNTTTRGFLERFVQKKQEKECQLKLEVRQTLELEVETAPGVEAPKPPKVRITGASSCDSNVEICEADPRSFGIVTDKDKQKDNEALKKMTSLLAERAKMLPLPSPPLPSASDAPDKSDSRPDTPVKPRNGDLVVDGVRNGGQEGNNEEERREIKVNLKLDRLDMGSCEQGRHLDLQRDRDRNVEKEWDREIDRTRDRNSRDRDREKERERIHKKNKEYEQAERERERNRARRERDQEERIRDAERRFEDWEKEWERIEKEKERRRNVDKEKEKERERHRKRLILDQEEDHEDEAHKKCKRRADFDERKRREREREDDEMDRAKEEEEIAEAKQRKLKEEYEEQVKKKMAEIEAAQAASELEGGTIIPQEAIGLESEGQNSGQMADGGGNGILENIPAAVEVDDDAASTPMSMESVEKRVASPPRRLGFGLLGSGKRALVPSVFYKDEEEEVPNNHGFRELVPIEYSAEEMQAVSSLKVNTYVDTAATNMAAAEEFAKSLSNLGNDSVKDESNSEVDRCLQQTEKSKSRGEVPSKDRNSNSRAEMDWSGDKDKHKQGERNPKEGHASAKLDTKQLIDMIPKKKDELFAYRIDWKVYDQHELHERMKPWIEKKIVEFLGEEEPTLVDYIVSNTRKHTSAAEMLDLLTTILDDEAELFVMKLWRMLIFEVKKIEAGLSKPNL